VTELRAGKFDFCFRQQQRFFSSPKTSRPTQLLNGQRDFFKKESGRSVRLTSRFNLVSKGGTNHHPHISLYKLRTQIFPAFFLDFFILEHGADRLSRNVSKRLLLYAEITLDDFYCKEAFEIFISWEKYQTVWEILRKVITLKWDKRATLKLVIFTVLKFQVCWDLTLYLWGVIPGV
jgi:hypothetical protein